MNSPFVILAEGEGGHEPSPVAVEWVEVSLSGMRRWFQFRVTPELVAEFFRRLQAFSAAEAVSGSAEPSAAPDPARTFGSGTS